MAQNQDPTYALVGCMTMTTTDHLRKILAHTSSHPIPPTHQPIKQKPMNRNLKTGGKMADDNDSMEDSKSTSKQPTGLHAMTTQSLACLTEKLKS